MVRENAGLFQIAVFQAESLHEKEMEAGQRIRIMVSQIQPLVENAIRHGVRIREHGRISVHVKDMHSSIRIIIKDNGKGFDVNAPGKDESRSHIGLGNVAERIETMCYGTVDVDSKLGVGTTITITIPK